ncbi:hypothetical protein [Roseovarius salis]|uniref:hypothetical protein n=1 Tax=Roseovarius salis TaxID=3376063 RepID=UPI0037CAE02D
MLTYRGAAARLFGVAVLVAGLAAAGCTRKEQRVYFDGNYYPTKARAADRSDRQSFTLSVRRADQGLAGARAAGRHGGKKYCLTHYGTSEIEWTVGPDAPAEALGAGSGRLSMSGRCILW